MWAQAPAARMPKTVSERMQLVENSLMPYVPVEGLAGWNLAERMKFHRVPGLSIAIIRDYKIEWATLFSAGSISKMVAGGAAMLLVQQGKLDLDRPINTYLKSWRLPENDFTRKRPVSLRLLLSHQGGTSQMSYWGYVPGKGAVPTVVDILSGQPPADSRAVVVNREPGTEFQYSGGGYLVAQMAMMDVTGRDFATYTQEALFRPLRMRSATFAQPLPAALQPRAAWAYSEASWYKGMPYVYPHQAPAGLYATPTDVAKFIIEVQQAYRGRGKLLKQGTAKTMLTPQVEVSNGTYREEMGLGPFLLQRADRTDAASRYFEHTGVNAGRGSES
jgi:CubicO group peptidase (beta-lactamase class C family)